MTAARLHKYEGADVAESTVRVTRAGDGLSEALTIAPVEYHLGDIVFLVLKTACVRVSHEPIKDSDDLRRVHTLAARFGTVVAEDLVADLLDAQRQAIDTAAGVVRLPLDEDGE